LEEVLTKAQIDQIQWLEQKLWLPNNCLKGQSSKVLNRACTVTVYLRVLSAIVDDNKQWTPAWYSFRKQALKGIGLDFEKASNLTFKQSIVLGIEGRSTAACTYYL